VQSKVENYLAIDLGAESGRAIIGSFDGQSLTLNEVHRFQNNPVQVLQGNQQAMHWDILRLWSEIKSGISLAKKNYGHFNSLGVDTWGVDFGLLDRSGNLLENPYHYRDNRTDGMMQEAFTRVPRQQVFEQTGIQFMQINTLYQLLSMVLQKSPALEAAATFLTIPDLLNYWLTGVKSCEFTIATTTQCFDPRKGNWAYPLLEKLNIPTKIFPSVVSPGALMGPLHPKLAAELGISDISVIAPACHDTGSAVAAVPAESDNYAWISSGTWSIMGVVVPEPIITPESLEFNFTNEGGASYLYRNSKDNTYRYSKNIMGLWLVQECRRTWAAQGRTYSYQELTDMAAQADPLLALVNPDSNDFLKPGDMPARIQAYCSRTHQPVPETPAAIVRCALESIALKYRHILGQLEITVGKRLDPIHIIGGGTQNRLLNQLSADATGRNVVTGPIEATAVGNILVQALALGHISSIDEVRSVVKHSFTPELYTPKPNVNWDAAYKSFLDLEKLP
jgi:rhamnulokinase